MPTTIELEQGVAATGFEPPPTRAESPVGRRHLLRPDDQSVLSIRVTVPETEAERFIAGALHDVRVFMQEHHVSPAGPPFSICLPRGSNLDIEAGWPIATNTIVGTSRIRSGSLPRSLTGPRDGSGVVDAAEGRR